MKVLVFGSTGSMGLQLVGLALAQGHEVAAFVRNPAKLDGEHKRLEVIQGDAMEIASVERAVEGREAVLCSLGAGRKGTVRAEGTRNIILAMEKAGVRRLICQTTLGVGESRDNLNFFWKYAMFGGLLRQAYADHVLQENYVRESRNSTGPLFVLPLSRMGSVPVSTGTAFRPPTSRSN